MTTPPPQQQSTLRSGLSATDAIRDRRGADIKVAAVDIQDGGASLTGNAWSLTIVATMDLSSVTAWDESCRLVYVSQTAAYMRLAG
jgi:hypothetical protein